MIDKPVGVTSFSLVGRLRKILNIRKIGHAGTLDPFATGLMVMLIGRNYTRLSDRFLTCDKEYIATAHLGVATDSFDCDGAVQTTFDKVPTLFEVESAIAKFQGEIEQIPPMYSAKKIGGRKLYDLARKGQVVERAPVKINVVISLLEYSYPVLRFSVSCSKGTYIRSLAHDIGQVLECGAHLTELRRTRSGTFSIDNAISLEDASRDEIISALHTDIEQMKAVKDAPSIHPFARYAPQALME